MTTVAREAPTRQSDPFITKVLAPKRPFGIVRRERLLSALSRAVDRHRMALITAPAGYGKTSLVADFVADVSAPICWYSVDPEDNEPRTFLRYLLTSIRQQFPEIGEGLLHSLNSSSELTPTLANLVGALVSEIQEQVLDWFVLVIEDLHWCDDPGVLRAVNLLLRHLPENCFVVLTSRTRVPLGALSSLTAHRSITRLTSRELAFTEDEVLELLRASGQPQDPAAARKLTSESEGWIAGIILLAPWLDQPLLSSSLDSDANREELFWYLSDQVFQQLPARWQDLLLKAAVLQDVPVDLCVEAFEVDDAPELLKQMEQAGLFLTELRDGATYRYHALFRQFLLDRAQRSRAPVAAWHCAAARFYASRGSCSEAVAHYLAAEDAGSAAAVLEANAAGLYQRGEWPLLAEMIASVERQTGAPCGVLSLWRARCLVQLGEPDAALALTERLPSAGSDRLANALRQIVRAGALRAKGRMDEATDSAENALEQVKLVPETPETRLLRGDAHVYIGVSRVMAGRHREALPDLEMALTLFEAVGSLFHIARVHSNLGISLYRLGRYPEAIEHYEQAIDGCRRLGNTAALASALNNLGNLYISIGSVSLAQDLLASALEAARLCGNTRVEAYATHSLGEALTITGQLDEAALILRDAITLARQSGETVLEARALLSQARVSSLRRSFRESEMLICQAEDLVGGTPTPYNQGLIGFSRGLSQLLAGDVCQARAQLSKALQDFVESGDVRWIERTRLLLAQVTHQSGDSAETLQLLTSLEDTATSEAGPPALRVEAALARDVLDYAVDQLPNGRLFTGLRAIADAAATAAPTDLRPASKVRSGDRPVVKALALGEFAIELNGSTVDESNGLTPKAKELLFYLLTTRRRARRDELIEALWPEKDATRDSSVLRTNVYRLRKVLYDGCILVQGDSYRIDPSGHFWFDLHYFKELVQRARQPQCSPVERVMLLETAVELYRGPFLDELSADWCAAERYDIEVRFANAARALAAVYLDNGRPADALALCERVAASDAFDEEAILLLVRAYLALGDRAAAVLHWRSFERRLQAEGGGRPSPEACSRYELLLHAS